MWKSSISGPSQTTTTAAAAASTNSGGIDRLEELEEQVQNQAHNHDKLSTQIAKMTADQTNAALELRNAHHSLNLLHTTTTGLTDAFKSLDDRLHTNLQREVSSQCTKILQLQSQQQDFFESQVKRLLSNFKEEIVCSMQQTTDSVHVLQDRVDSFQERLIRLEEAQKLLRDDHHDVAQHLRQVTDANLQSMDKATSLHAQKMDQNLAELRRYYDDLSSRIDMFSQTTNRASDDATSVAVSLEKTKHDLSAALNKVAKRVEQITAELSTTTKDVQEAIHNRLGSSVQHAVQSVEQNNERIRALERQLVAAQLEVSALSSRTDDVSKTLSQSTDSLTDRLRQSETQSREQLLEVVKKLEHDMDRRHKKLVESTHQALEDVSKTQAATPTVVGTMQTELQQVRETLHLHSVAIDAQRMTGNLETAFAELKDWIQDIERRLVTRSEVEEITSSLSSQLQSFKQRTMSTEMLLGERLDAERAAREHDTSYKSAQLQQLQSVLKR